MEELNVYALSIEQMEALERKIQERKSETKRQNQAAYLGLREGFITKVKDRVLKEAAEIEAFANFVKNESTGFLQVMREYGQLRRAGQMGYVLVQGNFKLPRPLPTRDLKKKKPGALAKVQHPGLANLTNHLNNPISYTNN